MSDVRTKPARTDSIAGSMFGVYLVALAICLAGNLAVRIGERGDWLPAWGRIMVAVLSAVPLIVAAGLFWRMLKQGLDEMLQRIVLEGLAFATIVYVPMAGLYLNLRTAGAWTPVLDPPDILFAPALLVAIGIAIAWWRFR